MLASAGWLAESLTSASLCSGGVGKGGPVGCPWIRCFARRVSGRCRTATFSRSQMSCCWLGNWSCTTRALSLSALFAQEQLSCYCPGGLSGTRASRNDMTTTSSHFQHLSVPAFGRMDAATDQQLQERVPDLSMGFPAASALATEADRA